MSDEYTVHNIVEVMMTAAGMVVAFFTRRTIKELDDTRLSMVQIRRELQDHRYEDAGKYATNTDVRESLQRIHDRIDKMADDIKQLIGRH